MQEKIAGKWQEFFLRSPGMASPQNINYDRSKAASSGFFLKENKAKTKTKQYNTCFPWLLEVWENKTKLVETFAYS